MDMTFTDHNRAEFARMAQAAYFAGRSDIGHRFSVAASRRSVSLSEFDVLMADYRAWLVFGLWPVSPAHRAAICDAQFSRRAFHWIPQTAAPSGPLTFGWSAYKRLSYVGGPAYDI
jgi:hypothetical protein